MSCLGRTVKAGIGMRPPMAASESLVPGDVILPPKSQTGGSEHGHGAEHLPAQASTSYLKPLPGAARTGQGWGANCSEGDRGCWEWAGIRPQWQGGIHLGKGSLFLFLHQRPRPHLISTARPDGASTDFRTCHPFVFFTPSTLAIW